MQFRGIPKVGSQKAKCHKVYLLLGFTNFSLRLFGKNNK